MRDFNNKNEFIREFSQQLPKLVPEITLYTSFEYFEDVDPTVRKTDFLFIAGKGKKYRIFFCEARFVTSKTSIRNAIVNLDNKFYSNKPTKFYPLIIAPYMTREGRIACIEEKVGYIDLSGNCYLRIGRFRVDRSAYSESAEKKVLDYYKTATLFSSKSSRIARLLLQTPGVWLSISELASKAKISKSMVYRMLSEFDNLGYTERKRGQTRLINPAKLLDEWSKEYDYRHNQVFNFFSFAKSPEEIISKIETAGSQITGRYALTMHAGASLIAPFVRFNNVHLYVESDIVMNKFIEALDLKPTESGGNIIFLLPYDEGVWIAPELRGRISVVSRIQLYLDLMSYPARGKEQAEFLRKQALSF